MLKLIIGRSGTGKSTLVLERLCADRDGRGILLVPEPRSHETERRLCRMGGPSVNLYGEVLTFTRLATRIFQTAGGLSREELDEGGRLLLMYRAVQSVAGSLTAYARPSRRPAFLSGLLATLDELKSCCVAPGELIRVGREIGGPDGERLSDLGLICDAYDALAAQTSLDPRDRLSRAADRLDRCGWVEGTRFYLDGFIDFTPQQLRLVELLLARGAQLTVALTCDSLEGEGEDMDVFAPARLTARRLRAMARKGGVPCEVEVLTTPSPARSLPMQQVEAGLFDPVGEPVSCRGQVGLFCAPDERTQVEWTAAKILELVRDKGLRYRDIAVAARGYERYDGLVESVFDRYGIPVFRSGRSDILQKPVMTLVTAALDAVCGGYTYDDMFRYLKTGLTGLEQEERDLLENYVLTWDLWGSRWTQERPWDKHPGGYGLKFSDEDRALVARLDELRRQVVAPLEELRSNKLETGRGQALALYTFLERLGLSQRLEERCVRLRERGELGLAAEYEQLWEILCAGLEQCARLLDEAPIRLQEFARLLGLVLSQYTVGTIPVSLDRVTAGELAGQSGHDIRYLFLLGADDSSIPAVAAPGGLLCDEDRELLAGYGLELGLNGRDRLQREMTAVYTACTRPDEGLFVTWPQRSARQELSPCFVVERLKALFCDLTVEHEGDGSFRLAAPGAAMERAGTLPAVRRALAAREGWRERVARLERAESWQRGSLSRSAVDSLYGHRVSMSATKMDRYKSCHFAYFMQYGLRAEPREPAGFDAAQYGTFVHYVLERVLQSDAWRGEEGQVLAQPLRELTARAVEDYINTELGGLEDRSARFRYLFRRLVHGVDQIVDNVVQELAASRFRPIDFELGFGRGEGKQLPPVEFSAEGVTLSMTGFVDRVDGWQDGDGTLYLRVVDYKTGKKTFDLTEVANGMGLQMLLYLFTLQKLGPERYGRPVAPAGVLYLPARSVTVAGSRTMDEAERRKKVDSELRRHGLVLDDPRVLQAMERPGEEGIRFLPVKQAKSGAISGDGLVTARRFVRLERHVERVLRDICREIAAGNIAADPFWRAPEKNACRYCRYAGACHFEEGRGGDCRRWLPGVSAQQFWQEVAVDGPADPVEGNEDEDYEG